MKNIAVSFLVFVTACGDFDPLVPWSEPKEGMVGECQIVCDYSVTPTVLRAQTDVGSLMSCQQCRDLLVYHFNFDQCTKPVSEVDLSLDACQ